MRGVSLARVTEGGAERAPEPIVIIVGMTQLGRSGSLQARRSGERGHVDV